MSGPSGAAPRSPGLAPGAVVQLSVGPVAHGGHCVARHDNRVVFVRHALPGEAGEVTLVESGREAAEAARRALADLPQVRVAHARVERVLDRMTDLLDLAVLDPPRSGAGAAVVEALVAVAPRAVAYVACDPAALARDVRTFREAGWRLAELRAFDAFPMTHHVECVALLTAPPRRS